VSRLRLIADDLTGALDTAAELAPVLGSAAGAPPVRVVWAASSAINGVIDGSADALAVDIASREGTAAAAARAAAAAAGAIGFADADLAFLKLDSLLRGHAGRELAAVAAAGAFSHVVVAPAFPFQDRRTRAGRQWAPLGGVWQATGEDIAATLAAVGVTAALRHPGDAVPAGVSIWDAERDADLAAIVAAARALPGARILWSGSGGLAGALAAAVSDRRPAPPALAAPLLGLFGTDHPVTAAQLDRAGAAAVTLADGGDAEARRVAARLAADGVAFARLALPPLARDVARARIAAELGGLADRLPPPATLVCGGGETLRALLVHLGAAGLDVVGRIVPGVPVARLVGGRWSGVPVVSKSGAFGDPEFLARLAALAASPCAEDVRP
jgi:uncharacterized protein YgbK (DUF1537 family)